MESEGYFLSDNLEDGSMGFNDNSQSIKKEVESDKKLYNKNKKAKVGDKIICASPLCNKVFTKKSYQQTFCCQKHKDQYWNRQRLFN